MPPHPFHPSEALGPHKHAPRKHAPGHPPPPPFHDHEKDPHPPPPQPGGPLGPHHGKKPPHEKNRHGTGKRIAWSITIGTVVTIIISYIIYAIGIAINVVLPVAAPILVGSITLTYSILGERG
ncbi:MAG: hypothetical protein COU08_04715 [Candidatus Harrisonbacteria bacterium CG10_big_fil_rev_8_21_14_0_10_42_17]|uniref:Uncharacterized protein n=1 Tax=Candidatus Harrisonbacteria bacterium CG10_big_fil_rev_8_21_14_0_10_42_17 TaxID=1974584 RepID=A0A2M6WGU3_9BACT|nr:MAG: hypothetical protein COU08_04715 [Candidatus Harrisonbacteria bacterium CG10_big_fil_rev_8_21_14_0_10_42_17]